MSETNIIVGSEIIDVVVTEDHIDVTSAGEAGPPGPGVPAGGDDGQVLAKASGTDYDTEWVDQTGGGGGGAVDSVNGETGVVVLSAADVGADATGTAAGLVAAEVTRADGTYVPVATVNETIDDRVATLLVAGTNITLTYNDAAGTLTIDAAGGGGGGLTQEQAEDIVAALIDDNSDLDWTYDDATASLVAVIKPGAVTNAMLAGSIAISKITSLQTMLDAKLPVFNIVNYGASTGSSDNTAAVQAAIDAAYAAGGGIVYVPNGTFICTGRLSIPGGVSAGQVAITIQGSTPQGIAMANIEASEPSTGSVLDLTYTDAGASGKIVALYEGVFGLKDIRIGCTDATKDDTPLIYVTLPQPRFDAVTFFGNTTHRLTACLQDAIVFGGTGTSHVENSVTSAFSGYGGFVRECAFWAIRKHVLMQNWVDGVVVEGCITDRSSCGSSETNSAPYVVDSGGTDGGHFAMGNIFQNNTIEVERYNYAFRFKNNAKNNVLRGNGIWDPLGGQTLGLAYVEESSGCTNNWLRFDAYTHSSFQNLGGITLGAGLNMVEKGGTQSPTTLFEYKPAGWQIFFNGTTNGNQSLIYDATIDGPLLAGNNGVGIRSAGRNQKIGLHVCSGSPEGVVTALRGSVCFNVAGGASTTFYVKESGDSTNTGWVAYGAPSGASVSDTAYDATTWNGDTTTAPSKNAVRDKIETLAPLASPALTGTPTAPTPTAADNSTKIATTAYADAKVADAITDAVTGVAPSQNAVFDALALKAPLASPTFTGTPAVPDDPYDATGWNGSTGIPTKNAIRDKIETLTGGGASVDDTAYDATSWDGDTTHAPSKNAVRDKIESMSGGGASVSDTAYDATSWDGVTTIAPSKNAVRDQVELLAPKASPTLTGTPAAPTAAQGTNTTQLATTAYVQTEAGLLVPKSLVDAKGDVLVGTAADTVARKAVGANGKSFIADSTQSDGIAWDYPPHARSFALKPTAALFETIDRNLCAITSGAAFLVSGTLAMTAIALPAGVTVTSISFMSGATALASGTHAWAALFDSSRALLGQSTDDTSPTWAATTVKTFTLATPFVTTYSGLHYLGLLIAASTVPNVFIGPSSTTSNLLGLAPILSGNSSTGLTGTAPNPAAAITAKAAVAYAYVS